MIPAAKTSEQQEQATKPPVASPRKMHRLGSRATRLTRHQGWGKTTRRSGERRITKSSPETGTVVSGQGRAAGWHTASPGFFRAVRQASPTVPFSNCFLKREICSHQTLPGAVLFLLFFFFQQPRPSSTLNFGVSADHQLRSDAAGGRGMSLLPSVATHDESKAGPRNPVAPWHRDPLSPKGAPMTTSLQQVTLDLNKKQSPKRLSPQGPALGQSLQASAVAHKIWGHWVM